MDALDRTWRRAVRPAWGSDGTIIFVGELEGLRKKGNDALKAAKLKYSVLVGLSSGLDSNIFDIFADPI